MRCAFSADSQVWVTRRLNMSAELVRLRKIPLLRVLDFVLRPSGPFAYADLSAPVSVCSKPLDLDDSDRQLTHLGKRVRPKATCVAERCNKRFRDGEELYAHLLEHREFCDQCDEEQDELLNRVMSEYAPEHPIPAITCRQTHSC